MRRSRIAIIVIAVLVVPGLIFTCSKVLTPTSTTTPTPDVTEYCQVGQRAETSREMLTVVSVERTDSYIRGISTFELMFQPLNVLGGVREHAAPGMVFIIIEAAVFNLGDRSLSISPRDFSLKDSEEMPVIDYERCVRCGKCMDVCPTGTLAAGDRGYRVLLAGKLGRHPRLAEELPGIYQEDEVVSILEGCLGYYRKRSKHGERFADIYQDAQSLGLPISDTAHEKKRAS